MSTKGSADFLPYSSRRIDKSRPPASCLGSCGPMARDCAPSLANQKAAPNRQNRFDFRSESHLTSGGAFRAHLGGQSAWSASLPDAIWPMTVRNSSASAAKGFQQGGIAQTRNEVRIRVIGQKAFACFPIAAVELRRRNARSVTIPSDLLVGNVHRYALNPSCYRTRFVV